MKTLLVLAGVALIGVGIYEYMHNPQSHGRRGKKGCGCSDGSGGTGGPASGAGGSANTGVNSDGSSGGTVVPVPGGVSATSTIPGGSASVDDIVNNGSNPADPAGVSGGVAVGGAGGGTTVNGAVAANLGGGGVNNPWGGNVPEVNSNFVYPEQTGGPDNSRSYPNMVQRFDASKQATVSPPITTISIPGGSASVQEMSWDKSMLLVKG